MANRRILLVEGVDDEHVMKHICGNHGIPHLDEIKEHGGAPNLLESVPVRIKASEEGDIVGIVIDADTNMRARWQSIRDRITTMGYENAPEAPVPGGTIIDPPDGTLLPRLGIWVMPDNRTDGILEDFLRFLVPQPSVLLDHAENSVADIPEGERRFRPREDEPKAVIHTWLAWQREPGKPFGTAITERFLDSNVAEARVIASWLRRLFYPDPQAT
jgi:hypothetical protein